MSKAVSKKISHSAISRVVALQTAELNAARLVSHRDTYPDFFSDYVDKGGGGGPHWHEAFEDVITPFGEFPDFSPERMAAIDALHLGVGEGYADFFVEGGGGNWHEAVVGGDSTDAENHQLLTSSASARVAALSNSNVLRAYARLKAGEFAKE